MEGKMAAGAFGRARNYGWDGLSIVLWGKLNQESAKLRLLWTCSQVLSSTGLVPNDRGIIALATKTASLDKSEETGTKDTSL